MILRQVTIFGSVTFSAPWQEECARFAVDHKIDVDGIFTHRWALEQADEAYKLLDQQACGKGVFVM